MTTYERLSAKIDETRIRTDDAIKLMKIKWFCVGWISALIVCLLADLL